MNITLDNWKGNINSKIYINNADYDMALRYLYKINGDKYTEMLLEDNGFSLSIAGGNNGHYVINIYKNNDSFILFDDNHDTGELLLNCGGQSAEFDLKYCFNLNFTERVLFEYFKGDNLFKLYKWEIS